MSGVKLQINNLEALERLIGGDTVLELELRKNIIHAFVDKYLTSLFDSEMGRKLGEIQKLAQDKALAQIATLQTGTKWNSPNQYALNSDIVTMIQDKVREATKDVITSSINVSTAKLQEMANEYYEKTLWPNFKRYLEAKIDAHITAEVDNRLANIKKSL